MGGGMSTDQALGTPVYVRILQTGIPDRRGIDDGCELGHVLKTKLVEHRGVLFLQHRQVNVFFNVFVFRTHLAETADGVDIIVKNRRFQTMGRFWGRYTAEGSSEDQNMIRIHETYAGAPF